MRQEIKLVGHVLVSFIWKFAHTLQERTWSRLTARECLNQWKIYPIPREIFLDVTVSAHDFFNISLQIMQCWTLWRQKQKEQIIEDVPPLQNGLKKKRQLHRWRRSCIVSWLTFCDYDSLSLPHIRFSRFVFISHFPASPYCTLHQSEPTTFQEGLFF